VHTTPRVLFLTDNLDVGGSEMSLLAITQRLRSVEPAMCAIFDQLALAHAFEAAGVPVECLGAAGKYPSVRSYRQLEALLHHARPDLLHVTGTYGHLLGCVAGWRTGIPVVGSLTSDVPSEARYALLPSGSRYRLRALDAMHRLIAGIPVYWVSNSEAARVSHVHHYGIAPKKVAVIYRGREPGLYGLRGSARAGRNANRSTSPGVGGPLLINVGRLVPSKGHADLVRAMAMVRERWPMAELRIAGEGHFRVQLARLIADAGLDEQVHLLGRVEDVAGLLEAADLFVFASHYEGLPGAVIEAMMAGCPIVISDIPVHREMIDEGETGLLVPVGNAEAFARAMVWMLEHPVEARRMGERARAVALERFDIDKVAAQYAALYTQVLRERQART
jgi:glycosyltransferase involved in cell wall biosynthesis